MFLWTRLTALITASALAGSAAAEPATTVRPADAVPAQANAEQAQQTVAPAKKGQAKRATKPHGGMGVAGPVLGAVGLGGLIVAAAAGGGGKDKDVSPH
jgi:hypothetical protein